MSVSTHYYKLLKRLQLVTATIHIYYTRDYIKGVCCRTDLSLKYKSKIIFVAHIFTLCIIR